MKLYLILATVLILVMIVFPLSLNVSQNNINNQEYDLTTEEAPDIKDEAKSTVNVLRVSSGKVESTSVNDYIIGAVACEMPASFNEEALKAQAVACYTYLQWILENSDNPSDEYSDISDSSATHQGYLNKEEMKEKWGNKFEFYYNKIQKAVQSVEGEYLCYNGSPILSVFHALSSGMTNSSEDVWGDAIPYLASVSAPGDRLSSDIDSTVNYTKEEFEEICRKNGITSFTIKDTVCSDSGYVKSITIGNKNLTGTDICRLFSLKSPVFEIEESEDGIIFHVKGKGHGIGMSQYSADFMARQGSSYEEILLHFYTGATIEKI